MKFNCGITGHTGILGSEIIKNFPKVKFIKFKGDITKRHDIKNWINKNEISYIFHFAAIVPTRIVKEKFNYAYKVNYIGTKYLVDEILKSNKIKWFFYSSTSHVYNFSKKKITEKAKPNPISKYGFTKLKAEQYIQKKLSKKIPYCIARIFSFTHKKQSSDFVIPSIIKKIKGKNKNYVFDNTNHFRDFLDTKDISKAILTLYKNKSIGVYNIGSGKKISITYIINLISKKLKKNYIIKDKSKASTSLIADIKKIKKLKWKPTKKLKNLIYSLI